jgi:hypothetical protein
MKNKTNKIKPTYKGWVWIRFKIPSYITLLTLYGLAFALIYIDNPTNILTYALTLIGITIALSQTCFEYANNIKDKQLKFTAIRLGEWLLASSVWFAIALLITIFRYYLQQISPKISIKIPLNTITLFLDMIALLNFTLAADGVYKAINNLGYILWQKLDI